MSPTSVEFPSALVVFRRPLIVHCHRGLGTVFRRTDSQQKARDHLAIATTLYREMDMRLWLEKVKPETGGLA